jgi:hypothetical protein
MNKTTNLPDKYEASFITHFLIVVETDEIEDMHHYTNSSGEFQSVQVEWIILFFWKQHISEVLTLQRCVTSSNY